MLLNISYNQPEVRRKIEKEVGKPYTLSERFKMGGSGSPKMKIDSASMQLHTLLALDNNADLCNIELRPKGIIIMFRSILETYALIIPYYKLSLYKGDAEVYSIYRDNYFVKIKVHNKEKSAIKFLKKIKMLKNDDDATYTRVDDL